MKRSKLLLAVVGATVLLGALVASASAGRLEISSLNTRVTWARINYTGGFGTVECEAVIEGTYHSRTIVKTTGSLVGYVTAANITRCARGGATVNRETLPWHDRFNGFTGTLPNITTVGGRVVGTSWRIREPTFGITCTATAEENHAIIGNYTLSAGTVAEVSVGITGGGISCGSFEGTLSGNTTNADNRSGARLTVRLI